MLRLFQCVKYLLAGFLLLPIHLHAMQGAWDIGLSSSSQAQGFAGGATHFQLVSSDGLGFDIGYDYLDTIEYDIAGTTLNHSMSQLETAVLWQLGDPGLRLQLKAGTVFSLTDVENAGSEVISRFQPGYQASFGISAPIYQNIRVFGELGHQGWLDSEVPSHMKWRYGVRMLFGKSAAEQKRVEQLAAEAEAEERERQLRENPPMTINASVPEYIPGTVSESLPPIVAYSELCKCFPRGPYTLQLGEFSNMKQAVRSLEFRGLRQFFNSFTYQRKPQPVFLSQPARSWLGADVRWSG